MNLARIGIYGAILCTLYFNGSYAYSNGEGLGHQWAMVALAVTIDICKCSFLPAAAYMFAYGYRIRPFILLLLFIPCFAFSSFAGYSYILNNRVLSSAEGETLAQARKRAQATYDQATADLKLARQHTYWKKSAGCTSPRTRKQRRFCSNITTTQHRLTTADTTLNQSRVVHVDPEIQTLATTFGLEMTTLEFIAAALPALILELVAGMGLYALNLGGQLKPSEKLSRRVSRSWLPSNTKTSERSSVPLSAPSESASKRNVTSDAEPVVESIDWSNAKPV